MLATLLSEKYKVFKTPKNLNGQIGVPLALFGLNKNVDYAVIEMGVSMPGEMDILVDIVKPDYGLLLNVAPVHTEFFGTIEGIIKEKRKLIDSLPDNSIAIINGDQEELKTIKWDKKLKIIRYGLGRNNDIYPVEIKYKYPDGIEFLLNNYKEQLFLPLIGLHNLYNVLSAIALCLQLGFNIKELKEGLRKIKPVDKRLNIKKIRDIWIIDDTYNAGPSSTKNAMEVLRDFPFVNRRIFVMGDMLELGDKAEEYHYNLGLLVNEMKIDYLLLYGELVKKIKEAAESIGFSKEKIFHSNSHQELANILVQLVNKGDVVLFKGSRGMRIEKILEYFLGNL